MRISLSHYQIIKAIEKDLEEDGFQIKDIDSKETYLCVDTDNFLDSKFYRVAFENKDWDQDERCYKTKKEYDIEGLYIKRRLKGGKRSEYVKAIESDFSHEAVSSWEDDHEDRGKKIHLDLY